MKRKCLAECSCCCFPYSGKIMSQKSTTGLDNIIYIIWIYVLIYILNTFKCENKWLITIYII